MKKIWGGRLTTVFPRQEHYGYDPGNIAAYAPTDLVIERIGGMVKYDLTALLGASKTGYTPKEIP